MRQPGTTRAGLATSADVAVTDDRGAPLANSASSIRIALIPARRDATLAGSTIAETQAGVAHFDRLVVDKPGFAYALVASADGFLDAISEPFQVYAWSQVGPPLAAMGFALDPQTSGVAWAAARGPLLRSDDGGRTWSPATVETGCSAVAVAPGSPSMLAICGGSIISSRDSGATWSRAMKGIAQPFVNTVAFSPSGAAWAGDYEGNVYARIGDTWSTVSDGTLRGKAINGFAFAGGRVLVAVDPRGASGGGVYAFDGSGWTASNSGLESPAGDGTYWPLTAIAVIGGELWTSSYGKVFASDDGGLHWADRSIGLGTGRATTVVAGPGGALYVGLSRVTFSPGSDGLFRSDDGGQTWTRIADRDIRTIAQGGIGLLVGAPGGVWLAQDATGTLAPATVRADRAVFYTGVSGVLRETTAGLILSASDGVFRSTDHGHTWDLLIDRYLVVAVDADSPARIAGTDGQRVFASDDGGATWREATSNLPGNIGSIAFAAGHTFAVTPGKLWIDHGSGWAEVPTVPSATWDAFVASSPRSPSSIYFAGIASKPGQPSVVLRSDDAGQTWTDLSDGLPCCGVESLVIDPTPAGEVVHAATNRGTYRRDAGGWTKISDSFLGCIERDPYHAGIVVRCLGGRLERSGDGGATWTALDSALGTPRSVAFDPSDPQRLLAAGDGLSETTVALDVEPLPPDPAPSNSAACASVLPPLVGPPVTWAEAASHPRCTGGVVDGGGRVAFQIGSGELRLVDGHTGVTTASVSGVQYWSLIAAPSGFEVLHENGNAFADIELHYIAPDGTDVIRGGAGGTYSCGAWLSEAPTGSLLSSVCGDELPPVSSLRSLDATAQSQSNVDVGRPMWGFAAAMSAGGRVLVVEDGEDLGFGPASLAARWPGGEWFKLTAGGGFSGLLALPDGGFAIALGGHPALTLAPGATKARLAPAWLGESGAASVAAIGGGRGVAVLPSRPGDTVRIYASGEYCGTVSVPARDLRVARDGTLIGTTDDTTCSPAWWPALLGPR